MTSPKWKFSGSVPYSRLKRVKKKGERERGAPRPLSSAHKPGRIRFRKATRSSLTSRPWSNTTKSMVSKDRPSIKRIFEFWTSSSNDFLNDWMLYVISWSDNGFLCCRERILNYCFFFFFFWFGSLVNPQLSLGDLSCDVNTPFGYYCNLDCRNLFLHFLF